MLRLRQGDAILLFNGRDGEWRARIEMVSKRAAALRVEQRLREQTAPGDLHYAFAPLKQARLDYMVQKATEMGAARLTPVLTKRTQKRRVSARRLRANAIEAAEQCGLFTIPRDSRAHQLDRYLEGLERSACSSSGRRRPAADALASPQARERNRARAPALGAHRTGRRLRRNGARADIAAQQYPRDSRPPHPARGYGGGRRARINQATQAIRGPAATISPRCFGPNP